MLKTPLKNTGDTYAVESYNNTISQELQNVVLQTGQTLSAANQFQLLQAATRIGSSIFAYTDTGTTNNYVLNPVQPNFVLTKYIEGMTVIFKVTNSNTGDSFANVSGLGNILIVNPNGNSLIANQLVENLFAEIVYSEGRFILVEENAIDSTLRTELLDTTPGTEGATQIGHISTTLFNFLPKSFGKVFWNGATYVAVNAYNVINVNRIGVGVVDVTFSDPMTTTNYGVKFGVEASYTDTQGYSADTSFKNFNDFRVKINRSDSAFVDTSFHFVVHEVR